MENSVLEAPLDNETDYRFMALALDEAKKAEAIEEVPVGAVIVINGKVVGQGQNRKETGNDPTAHAEIVAIREVAAKLKGWRLKGATLYVTLEPCTMCMGALLQARVERLVFATTDPKAGACGSLFDLSNDKRLNHAIKVTSGVMKEEASTMLKDFFARLRK
jgi:tRNA(adenine34) deaminase